MYLSIYLLQHVYQHNRRIARRYDGSVAIKLNYLTHIQNPYVNLNYNVETVPIYNGRSVHGQYHYKDKTLLDYAIRSNCSMEIIRWVAEHHGNDCWRASRTFAIKHDRLDIVKWLYHNTQKFSYFTFDQVLPYLCTSVKKGGQIDILLYLYEKGYTAEKIYRIKDVIDFRTMLIGGGPTYRFEYYEDEEDDEFEVREILWILAHNGNLSMIKFLCNLQN